MKTKLLTTIIAMFFCVAFTHGTEHTEPIATPPQTYKFVLTHMLGKKLDVSAHFVTGNTRNWVLDFRNGKKINYKITSMNEQNPMCGINALDQFGDRASICITKTTGDGVAVEIKYGDKRIQYKGYLSR